MKEQKEYLEDDPTLGLADVISGQELAFPLSSSWSEVKGEGGHM